MRDKFYSKIYSTSFLKICRMLSGKMLPTMIKCTGNRTVKSTHSDKNIQNMEYIYRLRTSNDKKLRTLILEEDLVIIAPESRIATYHHFTGQHASTIDLIITKTNNHTYLANIEVDQRNPLNSSSHNAVTGDLSIILPKTNETTEKCTPAIITKTRWNKVDKAKYQEKTKTMLHALRNRINNDTPTEIIITRINNILLTCAQGSSPQK